MKRIPLFLPLLLLPILMFAQRQTPLDVAMRHIEQQSKPWGLQPSDIGDLAVSDLYTSTQNGVTYVYLVQRHEGVEVYNAIANLAIRNGQVLHAGNRLQPDLAGRVNATKPVLGARQALERALGHLGLPVPKDIQTVSRRSTQDMTFGKGEFSRSDVPVKLRYQPMADGRIRLAWDLAIDAVNGGDYWSLRIDALNGELLDKFSWTVHCSFEAESGHDCANGHALEHRELVPIAEARSQALQFGGAPNTYNVFPLPVESPAHGTRGLVVNPADAIASPFGWHDTNGAAGAEYTITRGNNVHAFPARDANFSSKGDEPNGGPDLIFDLPLDPKLEPETFTPAATVNLFYAINRLHDMSFHFGFTEEAGNFQFKNYLGIGQGNDHVNGLAQFGATGLANLNNADFSTPPDGSNGRMRMFLWDRSSAGDLKYLKVNAPAEVSGEISTALASFGPQIGTTPITGEVRVVQDGTNFPTRGCQNPTNNLTGKIALIDRGGCEFGKKIVNAQNAGAIAVIICNFEEALVTMGAGAVGNQSTIPAVFIRASDCNKIRVFADAGLNVTLQAPANPEPPELLDGTLDNGIIAHEFAHGVSTRLTGGPSQSGCLGNEEQMGEGWSDFFSLIMTADANDVATQRRGIGTFVTREPNNGKGIRNFPYSTELNTNPVTYIDIRSLSVPHGVGSVWCSMLWDLYWAMADRYGYDPDFTKDEAGNNMAIRLMMEGLKLQPCSPGFVDGRNAILAADQVWFNGENQCLIWEVFARRGLGLNADQGASTSRSDGMENFDVPDCRPELKLRKQVTPLIQAGDAIEVTLQVINDFPYAVSDVTVRDLMADGTDYVAGSANVAVTQNGQELSFVVGNMAAGEKRTITYEVGTPANLDSRLLFYDGCEVDDENIWLKEVTSTTGLIFWEIQNLYVNSGANAWGVINNDTTLRSDLTMINPIKLEGDQPVLRFSHYYHTEYRADGGFVQISTDFGETWQDLAPEKLFREPYGRVLQYGTFAIPNVYAFSGDSKGFVNTYADLSDFAGEEVMVRFNFGCDGNTAELGWFMDDFTLMDMWNYDTEACLSYAEGADVCASAPGRGTVVEYGTGSTSVKDPVLEGVMVYPNPAKESLFVTIDRGAPGDYKVTMLSTDGRAVWTQSMRVEGYQTLQLPLPSKAAGIYLVKVESAQGVFVEKVVVRP